MKIILFKEYTIPCMCICNELLCLKNALSLAHQFLNLIKKISQSFLVKIIIYSSSERSPQKSKCEIYLRVSFSIITNCIVVSEL